MRAALVLALGVVGCAGADGAPPAAPEVPVTLATVRRDSLVVTIDANGRLVSPPDGAALLAAPADAMVRELRVQPGASVGAGEVVVQLDAPDLVASARSLRAQALAARQDADRQRQLVAEGISARRQAEERDAASQALEAQAAAAEALLERTAVRTPLAGVVSRVMVRRGERVSAGAPLVEVINPLAVYIAATVPAGDLPRIRSGQTGTLRIEGVETEWPVRVESVGAVVDSVSNSATVLLRPSRTDPMLRPGLPARIRLRVAVHHDVLIVPAAALVYAGDAPTVFVVGPDSVARARSVTPGPRSGADLEVEGALRPGDRVVVTGAYGLPDSTRVLPQGGPLP